MTRPTDRRSALAALAGVLVASSAPARAAGDSFDQWLIQLRADARAQRIDQAVLDAALDGVRPIQSVIDADRRQPETQMTFAEYRRRVVNPERIARGRELLNENAPLLDRVEARYGIPSEVMVALWGVESNFGERQGGYSVFGALATLAYEGRRAAFFRRELMSALLIADRGFADTSQMRGSWAGAMGQNQFIPSTYLGYAVDFDGDGRRDIWTSLPDVFASMANYLAKSGWDPGYLWGREVLAPADVADDATGLQHRLPLAEWQRRGVRLPDGSPLPVADVKAALLRPDGSGPSFLAYGNFRALMAWNKSTYFGVSIGLLSDSLKDGWRS